MKRCLILAILFGLNHALFSQPKQDSIKLFLKCSNMILLTNYTKYSTATSQLSVEGGRIVENIDNNKIAIMPDSTVIKVIVKQRGKVTNTVVMYGVPTPPALAYGKINGKDLYGDASGPKPSVIEMVAVPNVDFQAELPKESTYRVTQWEAVVLRNGKEILRLTSKEQRMPDAELKRFGAVARPGDAIKLNAITVKRRNALREMIPENFVDEKVVYTIR